MLHGVGSLFFGFQNCIIRLILLLLSFLGCSSSPGTLSSIDNFDFSDPWELKSLLKLAILPLFLCADCAAGPLKLALLAPFLNCGLPYAGFMALAMALSRVMVELLLVRLGTSSTDMRISGPGSPNHNGLKPGSSRMEEGAVDWRWVSCDRRERGDGNGDWKVLEFGVVGVSHGGWPT